MELKPNAKNPKKRDDAGFERLKKSLEKFGRVFDGIANADYSVIDGHSRLELSNPDDELLFFFPSRKLSKKEYVEMNAMFDEAKAGSTDMQIVEQVFTEAQMDEWGLDKTIPDAVEDDYEVPEGGMETDIVLGDLFEIGEHRLLCGDSTDSDSVAKLMNGEKADMVFTDPPYNVDYVGKTKEKLKIQNDKHNVSEFRKIISDAISNLILFTKRGGAYYVCIPLEVGVTDLFLERTHLQSVLIWLKNTIVMGRKDYQQQTEPILFLLNDTEEETYEGIVYGWNFGDSHEFYGGRKQSNVWKFDKPQRNGKHPTMKPIPLVGKAINNSSKEKDLILDLFIGSGTTMVASHQLNRKCYGIELDPKYCQVIIDRMRKLDPSLIIKKNGIAI